MPLFSAQRRRKTSRSPSPHRGGGSDSAMTSHNNRDDVALRSRNQGLFSSLRSKQSSTTTTLLPTTIEHNARRKHHHHHGSMLSSQNTCNNFLLGGSYYPGKDKKRRVMRQKALWYRIFCSSPTRVALTTGVAAYIVVWHVLVPLIHLLLYYGTILSGRGTATLGNFKQFDSLLRDTSLSVQSWRKEQSAAIKLDLERERLRNQNHPDKGLSARLSILEAIAPDWYHRNNPQWVKARTEQENKASQQNQSGDAETDEEPSESTDENQTEEDKRSSADLDEQKEVIEEAAESKDSGDDKKEEKAAVSTSHRRLRTIHNMDLFSNHSHCPVDLPENDIRATLVVQSSLNRVWVLEETCSRWKDPIVAVVALRQDDASQAAAASLAGWKDKCPQLTLITHVMDISEQIPEKYPVNRLRNMGLDEVRTSHVLVVDVDFVPAENLHETIRNVLKERSLLPQSKVAAAEAREALVVPAFERVLSEPCTSEADCMRHLQNNSSFVPRSFEDLVNCVISKDCIVFQQDVNWDGHSSTRSQDWLNRKWYQTTKSNATTPRSIRKVACFDSLRYEPYVVIRWCPAAATTATNVQPLAPYYDERFHGYGKNKIQLVQQLRTMGYGFAVLPAGFIVHNPHVESSVKEIWNNMTDSNLHSDMDRLYRRFLKELFDKYKDEIANGIIQQCDNR